MRCYRKILRISCKDHVTNQEVRAKIQQAIGQHEYILTTVKRRQLQWYGHVSRSSGMAKTILQDTVKGGRRRGRQRKKWEDNIREWTCLEFTKSQRAVENREKLRKLVAKLSLVLQRPSRLGDWWWWWWWLYITSTPMPVVIVMLVIKTGWTCPWKYGMHRCILQKHHPPPPRANTQTCARAHVHKHKQTRTHALARARTHTHTHTHTRARACRATSMK